VKRHLIAGVFVAVLLTAGVASAQEKGQLGLAMGFPTSVAFVWHPTENLGVRPDITFSHTSNDAEGAGAFDSDNSQFTVGVSALFYLHKIDNLRPYLSPRFAYGRISSTTDVTSLTGLPSFELTANSYSGSGSIGAQYAVSRRFSVFGETGLTYSHQHAESKSSETTSQSSDAFSTRSSVGVILYFK